jgi:hypothetical protein
MSRVYLGMDQMKLVVYLATNTVTGSRYVGMTKHAFGVRKKDHLKLAAKGSRGCPKFYTALRRYGQIPLKRGGRKAPRKVTGERFDVRTRGNAFAYLVGLV